MLKHSHLIYDWNSVAGAEFKPPNRVLLNDETLRDGLQCPSVKDPPPRRSPRRVPIDSLEIDRSFVRGLGSEADDDSIVTSVIDLACSPGPDPHLR